MAAPVSAARRCSASASRPRCDHLGAGAAQDADEALSEPREAPVTTATRPSRRNNPSISGAGIGAGYIVAAVALRPGLLLDLAQA
jgi:hypothetical protein